MSQALTPPYLLAAMVLLVAGAAKLVTPAGAVRALSTLGLPTGAVLVRIFALAEMGLGIACLLRPAPVPELIMCGLYVGFALLGVLLARRSAACGCFGETDAPATVAQALLSLILAGTSGGAALSSPHGVGWILARPLPGNLVLAIGLLSGAWALTLLYTELPRAWAAWSPAA